MGIQITSDFDKEQALVANFYDKFRPLVWRRVRENSLWAIGEVKSAMPVDTGRARAGWGVWSSEDTNNPESNPTDAIWLENEDLLTVIQGTNVEYVEYLNEGSSQQAPIGFIYSVEERAGDKLAAEIEEDMEALFKGQVS